jgi:hypothetical protein
MTMKKVVKAAPRIVQAGVLCRCRFVLTFCVDHHSLTGINRLCDDVKLIRSRHCDFCCFRLLLRTSVVRMC